MSWQKTALTHQKHKSLSDFFKHNTNRRIIYLKPWTSKWKCFSHIWSKWFWIIKKRGKILWNCICKLEKPLKNYKNHFWLGLVIGIAESDWAAFLTGACYWHSRIWLSCVFCTCEYRISAKGKLPYMRKYFNVWMRGPDGVL